jgi:hypothetical protein
MSTPTRTHGSVSSFHSHDDHRREGCLLDALPYTLPFVVSRTPLCTRRPGEGNSTHGRILLHERVDVSLAQSAAIKETLLTFHRDVVAFSAISVWPGFQTGNSAQVCIVNIPLARVFMLTDVFSSLLSLSHVPSKTTQTEETAPSFSLTASPWRLS